MGTRPLTCETEGLPGGYKKPILPTQSNVSSYMQSVENSEARK